MAAAQSEISVLSKGLKATYGDATWMSDAAAVPIREQMTAASRPVILTLFAAAVLLLVIACLNVSNLQLARASTRRREMAVRLAVGAGSGRLTRQLLAEALVLTGVAAIAGVGLAWAGVQALVALQPGSRADGTGAIPRVQDVQVDWTVLVFAVAVAFGAAVLLGIATAFRASRQEIRSTLTEGTRSVAGGRTAERIRQGLVIAQVALTIVLLVGIGSARAEFRRAPRRRSWLSHHGRGAARSHVDVLARAGRPAAAQGRRSAICSSSSRRFRASSAPASSARFRSAAASSPTGGSSR